ncbi:DMT family transporter [Acinetobacter nematophilus]|uniref:DMT family transporter n=1 Tax=Acinetobacter nematophilus TaxID=2994642 RepID=A0A9X3DW20_9GAMM|nr:DMT family transporter [Acinetobacter nematophilus]MCX5469010.1 DMT family transporter [Acinetobacter nematophilus]
MSTAIFGLILLAAAFHATWNAIVKAGSNKFLTTVLVTASAAVFAMLMLPFFPMPNSASWLYILASTGIQILYFGMVAKIYHIADMGLTYPLMRGTAPLIVAVLATVFLNEKLELQAWLGIITISMGILSMIFAAPKTGRKGIGLALLNAILIASYTLVDGYGIRLSGSPISYILWSFVLSGLIFFIFALKMQYRQMGDYLRSNWHLGLIGGMGSFFSYGLALWAMTRAPVAIVAALRETSILFATLITIFILKERATVTRILSSCIILIGALLLRIS